MFGMSMTEIVVILLIALIFMGPEKIPEAAKFVGKMMREVRKASNLLRDAVMVEEERPKPIRPKPLTESSSGATDKKTAMRDPDPMIDVRIRRMNPARPVDGVEQVALANAAPQVKHREVYLHVPYDETI